MSLVYSVILQKILFPEIDNQTALTASVVNRGNILGSVFLGVTKRNEIDASKAEAARTVENLKSFIDGLEEGPPAEQTNSVVVAILRSVSSEKLKQMEDYVKTKYPDPDPGGVIIKRWIDSSKGA